MVLLSVVLHGGSMTLLKRSAPQVKPLRTIEPAEAPAAGEEGEAVPLRMTLEEVDALREGGQPVVMLDVRSHRSYDQIGIPDPGAIRLDPDRPVQEAQRLGLPKEGWLIAYCA